MKIKDEVLPTITVECKLEKMKGRWIKLRKISEI
jgi:hypothetical protein